MCWCFCWLSTLSTKSCSHVVFSSINLHHHTVTHVVFTSNILKPPALPGSMIIPVPVIVKTSAVELKPSVRERCYSKFGVSESDWCRCSLAVNEPMQVADKVKHLCRWQTKWNISSVVTQSIVTRWPCWLLLTMQSATALTTTASIIDSFSTMFCGPGSSDALTYK